MIQHEKVVEVDTAVLVTSQGMIPTAWFAAIQAMQAEERVLRDFIGGSDPGMAVATEDQLDHALIVFWKRCQNHGSHPGKDTDSRTESFHPAERVRRD
jgi:hypothetical protein